MAKRFIDTALFDDEWFMELSKEGKLFWIYAMTKCDHAGILQLNEKLCKFQTGIKNIETVKEELGNRIIILRQPYLFIPKFLFYQYPNFPHSNAKAQKSAIEILTKFELFDKGSLTLKQGLGNNYGNGNGTDNGNGNGRSESEIEKQKPKEDSGPTYLTDQEMGELRAAWLDYLQHRQEQNLKPYKSHNSEKIKFNQLLKLSGNKPRMAQGIVNQSRANNWQGLFELKDESYLPPADQKKPLPKVKDI